MTKQRTLEQSIQAFRDRKRQVRDTNFYTTKKWRKVRDEIRKRDRFICQICGSSCLDMRCIVDHKTPLTIETMEDWDAAYNPKNLWLLCQTCHNRKTLKETKLNKNKPTKSVW